MDNIYYCEVIVDIENSKYTPGIYTFRDAGNPLGWASHARLIQISHAVCKETEDGVFWVKNRLTGSKVPAMLTEDELKQFMWTKLKAQAA